MFSLEQGFSLTWQSSSPFGRDVAGMIFNARRQVDNADATTGRTPLIDSHHPAKGAVHSSRSN